jgi:hypothetical protein
VIRKDESGFLTSFGQRGRLLSRPYKSNAMMHSRHKVKETQASATHALLADVSDASSLLDGVNTFFIHSTDVLRTIQSAYSEMTGLLGMWTGGGQLKPLTEKQRESSKTKMPFNVRRSGRIDSQLGSKPIVDGFVAVPVHTFIHDEAQVYYDNLDTYACNNISQSTDRPDVKERYKGQLERLPNVIHRVLNISMEELANPTFESLGKYCDAIFARNFEGILGHYLTEQEWLDIYHMLNGGLLENITEDGRARYITKVLAYPINLMDAFVKTFASELLDFQHNLLKTDAKTHVTMPQIKHILH